jgi:CRP-like cAMP-binding protein
MTGTPFDKLPPSLTGKRPFNGLREHFMDTLAAENVVELLKYEAPDLYSPERVTFLIPPIIDAEKRAQWRPSTVYVVSGGTVAIGRVFYTKTSGEYLLEELLLRRGDIFGEFEVPLSLFGTDARWESIFPPRFNMTYGAWASGPALNWAMSYPRYIPRDSVAPDNASLAVHPFYIKSKNIRPATDAEVLAVPVECFEDLMRSSPDLMSWFLMNVLRKTRLYFEPPSPGYSHSPLTLIGRLFIRLLAHRIRLGIALCKRSGDKTTCSTFIGPTEWVKYGLNAYRADLKEVIQQTGGRAKTPHTLPLFDDVLGDILEVTYHFPVKDLDDDMLIAMGCSPAEDRRENRYGLLTGIRIELSDLDRFMEYLLEKGE